MRPLTLQRLLLRCAALAAVLLVVVVIALKLGAVPVSLYGLGRDLIRVMMGQTLAELRQARVVPETMPVPGYVSVKEAVLPFSRFPGVDTVLGPEMRSTGEVMGIGESFGIAFAKAQLAAGRFGALVGVTFGVVGVLIILSFRFDWHPFSAYLPTK